MKQQPISVTVACWVIIALAIEAAVGLLSGIAEATLREMLHSANSPLSLSSTVISGTVVCATTLVLAAFMLAGENWARIAYMTLSTVLLGFILIAPGIALTIIVITGVKLIVFGFLLFRPVANEYFSKPRPPAA